MHTDQELGGICLIPLRTLEHLLYGPLLYGSSCALSDKRLTTAEGTAGRLWKALLSP